MPTPLDPTQPTYLAGLRITDAFAALPARLYVAKAPAA